MIRYLDAIEQLPVEIKLPLMKAFELFREEIAETVKRSDFEELKAIVRELADSQRRSEERLAGLERNVSELIEAQKKGEERLSRLETVVEELAEAQKRTEQRIEELAEAQRETQKEVSRLDRALQELAEAQKRTEQRIEELAEAQRETQKEVSRLDKALQELAEAQKKTEGEIRWLVKSHKELREEVGGLAHTVGYRLEDESYKALPELLKRDFGIEIKGRLKRDFIEIGKDRYTEVNIWGDCIYNGKPCVIVGEAKTQLKRKDIDDFIRKAEELKRYVPKEQVRVLVTYNTSPQVMKYAREKDIKVYFSYEF
ncbi:MAG: hypothetical protein ACK415_12075 [Thermodesulfovibrionales bacterium]